MARGISLHMYVTLDGYNEFPLYAGSDYPPPSEPDRLAEEMWAKRWGAIDALLFDPLTYEQWADFWPLSKRAPGEHPWYRQMAEFAERVGKVVFSDTPGPTSWAHTRYLGGELEGAIGRLRAEGGGNMAVVSPELGLELMRRGLIDDYYFAVFPVILGKGRPLFGTLERQQTLRLVEVKSFEFGELFLHYQVAG